MENANTNYDYTKRGPWDTVPEQYVTEVLTRAVEASTAVRPPIPNIGRTPPRFGYNDTPPTIMDILNVDSEFVNSWGDYSGTVSGYQGTSFPSLSQF